MNLSPSLLVTLLLAFIALTFAAQETGAEPAAADHDGYQNSLQRALLRGYLDKIQNDAALRARRFQAAKRPSGLFAHKAALRSGGKFYHGDAPEKRMYDYGLDYDSFVPPEKRSAGNRH